MLARPAVVERLGQADDSTLYLSHVRSVKRIRYAVDDLPLSKNTGSPFPLNAFPVFFFDQSLRANVHIALLLDPVVSGIHFSNEDLNSGIVSVHGLERLKLEGVRIVDADGVTDAVLQKLNAIAQV